MLRFWVTWRVSYWSQISLPFKSTWVVEIRIAIFLVFCVLFVFFLCLVCLILDCPILIAPSVFSSDYITFLKQYLITKWKYNCDNSYYYMYFHLVSCFWSTNMLLYLIMNTVHLASAKTDISWRTNMEYISIVTTFRNTFPYS